VHDTLIAGTDTGVGKTVIAAALIRALRLNGVRAIGFKPVETGLVATEPADSEWLQRASGEETPLARPLLQLTEPLAPAVAAARAGTSLHADAIEQRIDALRHAGFALVVEGAGGVMAPIAWDEAGNTFYTVLDLAEHCGLDAIVVGRAGLGTLNHVAMTVAMLRLRHIPVRGLVLNGAGRSGAGDLAEATNPETHSRMLPGLPIVNVPQHRRGDVIEATVPYLHGFFS
jgi:dethiobiotin synthetase